MTHFLRHWLTPHKSNHHRAKILHPDGLFFVAVLIIIFHVIIAVSLRTGPISKILGYSSDITAEKVLSAVNAQRAHSGLKPLVQNQKLNAAATTKANDMLANQYWSHNTPSGKQPWAFIKQSGYSYEVAGENLARNFSHTSGMVDAWLASSTHRANLLSSRYSETGIAVVNGKLDGVETTLVVQMFGTPSQPPAKPVVAEITEIAPTVEEKIVAPSQPAPEESLALPAVQPGPAAILGEETPTFTPTFSPIDLYRWSTAILLSFLIAVLLHDSRSPKKKKHTFFGKNLAHIILLVATITTVALTQGGKLL